MQSSRDRDCHRTFKGRGDVADLFFQRLDADDQKAVALFGLLSDCSLDRIFWHPDRDIHPSPGDIGFHTLDLGRPGRLPYDQLGVRTLLLTAARGRLAAQLKDSTRKSPRASEQPRQTGGKLPALALVDSDQQPLDI